jgi:uncharacterized protein (UPF0332 family)
MTGDDFLAIAGRLALLSGANTIQVRTSINRSYYGAFHLVNALLDELGIERPEKEHNLNRYLYESGEQAAKQASRLLASLYEYRRKADYDLGATDVDQIDRAKLCLEQARTIQSLLALCRQEPSRSLMVRGIRAWEAKTKRP